MNGRLRRRRAAQYSRCETSLRLALAFINRRAEREWACVLLCTWVIHGRLSRPLARPPALARPPPPSIVGIGALLSAAVGGLKELTVSACLPCHHRQWSYIGRRRATIAAAAAVVLSSRLRRCAGRDGRCWGCCCRPPTPRTVSSRRSSLVEKLFKRTAACPLSKLQFRFP